VTLTDSTVSNNTSLGPGGGIYNFGTVTLNGSSSVTANSAIFGAGIRNGPSSTLTMQGSSSITANTATIGGGIHNECGGTLNGAVDSGTGAKVTDNTPDQISNDCPTG